MKRWKSWIAYAVILALLAGCSNASSYIKDNYSLVDVDGKGKNTAKIYSVEGKDVPAVAKEIADEEKPDEMSKEQDDRMFLVYKDKIINVQKDPENEKNTLVELDSIEYAKDHYDSSFLQGYLTAALLQSLFGGGWYDRNRHYDYRGYTSVPKQAPSANTAENSSDKNKPTTSSRTGSFGKSSGSSGTSDNGSSVTRKNDGSTPSYKSSSKPSTSKRSGSFSRKK